MAIPDFQTIMRPLLEAHLDSGEVVNRDLVNQLADVFGLTEDERRAMLPSGRAKLFDNRVGWAKLHVTHAGLLTSPRRAISVLTERGEKALAEYPDRVDLTTLNTFAEYLEFRSRKKSGGGTVEAAPEPEETRTPEESLDNAFQKVRREVEADLLLQVFENPPEFLESVVVDLVVRMGYGGSRKDAGEAIGQSGDEGIDGIIKEDPLGLDTIYLQAKRWQATVTRPEIQKFAGALQGKRAKKGIFIATSGFSAGAREYVDRIDTKIILVDGEQLAKLMYDHGVGVTVASSYEVKRIDSDYFSDV